MTNVMNGKAMPEIRRWLQLYRTLNDATHKFCPMDEDAMDFIVSALGIVAQRAIEAPAKSEADVADKFRLLAELIDDPAGQSIQVDACLADAVAAFHALDGCGKVFAEGYAVNRSRAVPALAAAE